MIAIRTQIKAFRRNIGVRCVIVGVASFTYEGPGMRTCLGNQSTKNFNFFQNQIFDLRPDLAHL